MKICFFTNTFPPHVGGVAHSTRTFVEDFRRLGHRVLVVAPEFAAGRAPARIERSVQRVAAVQNFNGSDFSVRLPLATTLQPRLSRFRADIIHSHHPFLLGDSALRIAADRGVPVVFTHHTLYEQYTHYVPFDSPQLKRFVIALSTRYANCCQGVIAPSESIASLIRRRGVTAPIRVIPTGVDVKRFASGRRQSWRRKAGATPRDFLFGHVGRLAPEKNLPLLGQALSRCLRDNPGTRALIVGDGPARAVLERDFRSAGVRERVHFAGRLTGRPLQDAYAAMDAFVFASRSETQGMVLAEAMAAGCPVVALDASGVREVVRDRKNGRLLPGRAGAAAFGRALSDLVRHPAQRRQWQKGARKTAGTLDRSVSARAVLRFYQELKEANTPGPRGFQRPWDTLLDRIAIESRLVSDKFGAAFQTLRGSAAPRKYRG